MLCMSNSASTMTKHCCSCCYLEPSCRVRDRWRVPRPRVDRPGSRVGNASGSTHFDFGSRSQKRIDGRVVGMQSGGLAVTGVTNLAFLMDNAMSGLNDGEPGVSTSWLGRLARGTRGSRPRMTPVTGQAVLSIRDYRPKLKWIAIHDPT
jgi:hypothetical protein